MPSAAKLVKQASTEAPDPLRQGVTIIEHKIRNLEKRKGKLESYRALQNEGKDLQPEQLAAVAKYDEVIQTLEFARDLCKQFNSITADNAKAAKKQARKEALERQANDLARIKEVLLVQNVLNQIGTDAVREDFLNGQNGATQLTETDLQLFDTFYETVTPKSYDDAKISVDDQLAAAADHYLSVIDGKSKEFAGVTYTVLKEKITSVHSCGYFDKPSVEPASEAPVEAVEPQEEVQDEVPVEESVPVPEVVNPTFQAPPGQPPQSDMPIQQPPQPTPEMGLPYANVNPPVVYSDAALPVPQHQIPVQPPGQPQVLVPLRPHDIITTVTTGNFNFLQDSELDSPDPSVPQPSPHQIPPSAIPTQTFTNQTFPAQVNPPPASAVPMFHPQQHQPPPHIQPVHQLPGENFNAANQNALPIPQTHLPPVSPPNAGNPPGIPYQQQMYSPHSDRFDQSRNEHNDNHVESSQAEQTSQSAASQNINNKWPNDTDDWNNQNNDDWNNQNQNEWSQSSNNDGGYQTQRRDRGDREQRGRGKPRGTFNGYGGRGRGGNDRPYQNDRQGGNYYRNNNGEGGNNFYQNGYNKDGQGGYRGGRGGMDRPRPNRGGMDRGGPRGGGPRGNSRGRGGFRGGQSGQGVPSGGPGPKQ